MLDTVCPVEWRATRRRLCCVLIARDVRAHARSVAQLRALARRAPERLRYAYVYEHAQPEFVGALANGSG